MKESENFIKTDGKNNKKSNLKTLIKLEVSNEKCMKIFRANYVKNKDFTLWNVKKYFLFYTSSPLAQWLSYNESKVKQLCWRYQFKNLKLHVFYYSKYISIMKLTVFDFDAARRSTSTTEHNFEIHITLPTAIMLCKFAPSQTQHKKTISFALLEWNSNSFDSIHFPWRNFKGSKVEEK